MVYSLVAKKTVAPALITKSWLEPGKGAEGFSETAPWVGGVYSGGGAVGWAIEGEAGGGGFGGAQAPMARVLPAIPAILRPVLTVKLIWLLLADETGRLMDIGALRL